jgi:hypothetical protein
MSKVAARDSNLWPNPLVNRTFLRQAGYQQRLISTYFHYFPGLSVTCIPISSRFLVRSQPT